MNTRKWSVQLADEAGIATLNKLAHIIWPITFKDILKPAQISYMLELMYSIDSLKQQQEQGCRLYILSADDEPIGYLSLEHDTGTSRLQKTDLTKVHKIYVLPAYHGTGAGRFLMDFALDEARRYKSSGVFLNVNRYNKATGFYEHYGFNIAYSEDINIGDGYLMEDYVMYHPFI